MTAKPALGLLALFLVAVVGSAHTVAFLVDEEGAVISFAGNAAGNTQAGGGDTGWGDDAGDGPDDGGAGNEPAAPAPLLDPGGGEGAGDGPPVPPGEAGVARVTPVSDPGATGRLTSLGRPDHQAGADGAAGSAGPPPGMPPPR